MVGALLLSAHSREARKSHKKQKLNPSSRSNSRETVKIGNFRRKFNLDADLTMVAPSFRCGKVQPDKLYTYIRALSHQPPSRFREIITFQTEASLLFPIL